MPMTSCQGYRKSFLKLFSKISFKFFYSLSLAAAVAMNTFASHLESYQCKDTQVSLLLLLVGA